MGEDLGRARLQYMSCRADTRPLLSDRHLRCQEPQALSASLANVQELVDEAWRSHRGALPGDEGQGDPHSAVSTGVKHRPGTVTGLSLNSHEKLGGTHLYLHIGKLRLPGEISSPGLWSEDLSRLALGRPHLQS